jgi:predicted peptidase
MKKSMNFFLSFLLAASVAATPVIAEEETTADLTGTQVAYIVGDDWGPAVTKTILTLSGEVKADSIEAADFKVVEHKTNTDWTDPAYPEIEVDTERQILDAYASDAEGNKVETDSTYVTIEMYTSPSVGSPFRYDANTGRNDWCRIYDLNVTLEGEIALADGTAVKSLTVEPKIDFSKQINPQLARFDTTHKYTATDGTEYSYADFTGDLAKDDHKNPLFVWLHGGGEGGTDPSIVLLANEVTNYADKEFQDNLGGAYVLVPQAKTMWLDGYDWHGEAKEPGASIYNESLIELIKSYVDANPDIDTDRIYVSGCSNGGFMTINLAVLEPDYFAAYIPICLGYRGEHFTDEMIETIKDLPMWIIYAQNDTTLDPEVYSKPIIEKLEKAGASNLHITELPDVADSTGRFKNDDGTPYQYNGHWSWVYFDNNECEDANGENCWAWLAEQKKPLVKSMVAHVVGDDWGPAVDKAIITLNHEVKAADLKKEDYKVTEVKEAFDWGTFSPTTATTEREVIDVYLSDEAGNKVEDEAGKIVTVEMYVSPDVGSPFFYELFTGFNRWVNQYELTVVGKDFEAYHSFDFYDNDQWISELADKFHQDTYEAKDGTPIVYGEYVPESDVDKKALVIWLHGAGEGTNKGKNDNYIDLLGNEVTAFASDEFQSLYDGGAYVITPQAPTMWMDDGTGNYQSGDKGSCYADALFEYIEWYVAQHKDIDKDRIIIGGCSNGGYMTMEMTLKHPGYFYKAFPICEAFSNEFITDEMIEKVKEGGTAYWFTYALTDTTVDPKTTAMPTIVRFQIAGIETHVSAWTKVEDLTGRFKDEEGKPYEYMGHWSWIYFDNNANFEGDLNEWEWLADYDDYMGFKDADGNKVTQLLKEKTYYWYEHNVKQGTLDDPAGVPDTQFERAIRGREIYDPITNAWYWLDAAFDGAVAKDKEVWMPYIFQDEKRGSTNGKWVRYDKYGEMINGWYANDKGVYYYNEQTGAMAKGTQTINGRTYTFDEITGIRQ